MNSHVAVEIMGCPKCGETKPKGEFYADKRKPSGVQTVCKQCNLTDKRARHTYNVKRAVQKRLWQEANPKKSREYQRRYRANNKHKKSAIQAVFRATQRGDLVPQPCEVCGSTGKVHGHHDDYTKPLDVRWLCPIHHKAHHKATRAKTYTAPRYDEVFHEGTKWLDSL